MAGAWSCKNVPKMLGLKVRCSGKMYALKKMEKKRVKKRRAARMGEASRKAV